MRADAVFRPGEIWRDTSGEPINSHVGGALIDQCVFRDGDGQHYLIYGGWRHCNIARILQQDPNVATDAGHHSILKLPGEETYYIVYHRRPLGERDGNRRVTCIDRMEFDAQGLIRPVTITFEGVERRPLP